MFPDLSFRTLNWDCLAVRVVFGYISAADLSSLLGIDEACVWEQIDAFMQPSPGSMEQNQAAEGDGF
jgi:hypothetical protein